MNTNAGAMLRRIQIFSRRMMSGARGGDYLSAFKGAGIEFHQLREYIPGDDVRAIDWHSSLKHDKLMVKQFVQERDREVLILVDCSASGLFSSKNKSRMQALTEISAIIASIASGSQDRVGVIGFTDTVELYIPPKRGIAHVMHLIEQLSTFTPKSKKTRMSSAFEFLLNLKKRNTIIFVLSDWIDPHTDHLARLLPIVGRRYDMIALRLLDRLEKQFPALGMLELVDIETDQRITVNLGMRRGSGISAVLHDRLMKQNIQLRSCNIDLIDLTIGDQYLDVLVKFFHERKRR